MLQLSPLLLGFLALPAMAGEASLCVDLYKLKPLVRTCSFNTAFVKAADACNAAIDRESAAKSAALASVMARENGSAVSAQTADLLTHSANLGNSSTSLTVLRGEAVSADDQLHAYLANFMRPGGISPELAAHLHAPFLGWLEQFPCYGTNKALLTRYIQLMDEKIAKLDQTLGTVSRLAAKTDDVTRKVGADASSTLRNAGGPHAAGTGKNGARAPASASSVTGVENDSAKRAKTPY